MRILGAVREEVNLVNRISAREILSMCSDPRLENYTFLMLRARIKKSNILGLSTTAIFETLANGASVAMRETPFCGHINRNRSRLGSPRRTGTFRTRPTPHA